MPRPRMASHIGRRRSNFSVLLQPRGPHDATDADREPGNDHAERDIERRNRGENHLDGIPTEKIHSILAGMRGPLELAGATPVESQRVIPRESVAADVQLSRYTHGHRMPVSV